MVLPKCKLNSDQVSPVRLSIANLFHLQGPHVIQAGPQAEEDEDGYTEHGDEREFALKRFRDLDLEHLIYPEYAVEFPHSQWTLGFTGRPGGPDFYINKVDNSLQHGPGGQSHHDLVEFADPCFAKVIKGFDVLHKVFDQPTAHDGEWQHYFEDPVHITGAVLLDPKPVEEKHVHHPAEAKDEEAHHHKRQNPHIEHHVEA